MNETTVQNLDTLTKCAEQVNNIFTIVYKIAVNAKYPAFAEIVTAAENFNHEIFLVQNYLIDPDAENLDPSILAQLKSYENIANQNNTVK